MTTTRRWSDLPDLFLDLVARRLSLVDHMRFGLVCKSWRSVAIGAPPCRQPPWLLAGSRDPQELLCYSLWEDRTIRFRLPLKMIGWECCAASHGWLFMADRFRLELCLLNPVTRAQIDLPPLLHSVALWDTALSSDPVTAAATRDRPVVVVNYLDSTLICRVGDKRWMVLCKSRVDTHVTPRKGLLDMTGDRDALAAYDLDYVKSRIFPRWFKDHMYRTCYLIESGQEGVDLLHVTANQVGRIVLELFGGKDCRSQRWVHKDNLGGGALFVSRGHSEFVSADVCATMGMKGDCVYELDQYLKLREISMEYGSEPAAIPYHLQFPSYNMLCYRSLWFTPSIPSPSNRRKRVEKTEDSLLLKEKKNIGESHPSSC